MSYMMVMMIQRDPKACKGSEEALNFAILVGFPPRVCRLHPPASQSASAVSHTCAARVNAQMWRN